MGHDLATACLICHVLKIAKTNKSLIERVCFQFSFENVQRGRYTNVESWIIIIIITKFV